MEMTRMIDIPLGLEMATPGPGLAGWVLTGLALAIAGWVCWRYRPWDQVLRDDRIDDIDARLCRVDQHLQALVSRLDQLQLSQAGGSDYRLAGELIENGASTEQLVERCGMSRAEAELFQRLRA